MFNFPSFRRRKEKTPDTCPNCSAEIAGEWEFCPKCGARLLQDAVPSPFFGFDLFADIDKQLEAMDKEFFGGRNSLFEIPKPARAQRQQQQPQQQQPQRGSGPQQQVRGGGISITFSSGTGRPPNVVIHTSGDFKSLEPELRKRLTATGDMPQETPRREPSEERQRAPPEVTEEPEAELIKGAGGKIAALNVKLPGVDSAKDIKISRLPNSIEIKAYVKNKAYFKLFQLPPTSRITGTGFKNGVLTINLE